MKILSSGDWHISNKQTLAGRFVLQDGINITLSDRIKAISAICDYAETELVDLVVIPGDVFDNSMPDGYSIKVAVEATNRLAQVAPTIIARGNHDGKAQIDALVSLSKRSGIYLFDLPSQMSFLINKIKINMFIFPYPRTGTAKSNPEFKSASPEEVSVALSGKMEEVISGFQTQIEQDAINVFVGHFSISGSKYSPEQTTPLFDLTVRPDFLNPFDVVCLSHIHHAPQPHYSGTIARNGFGEEGMPVGFKVYTIDEGKHVDEQFIELPAREYITLSPEEFINNVQINPEAAVRIKGKVPRHQYDELVRKMKALNHPFLKNALEVEMETAGSNGDQDISGEPDVEAALRMWAKGRDGIDKFIDRLVVKGKEIEAKMTETNR